MRMDRETGRKFIANLAAAGRYHFTSAQARAALGASADATKLALNRLAKQKLIASPARGFYVIVPPEYRALGCLPADQFIPDLMRLRGATYYAGLLSAAQFHGAAHHRPQEFQVMVTKPRRSLVCGKVRVAFFVRKDAASVATQTINTPRGSIRVATPETTAIDLVGYADHAGGLDQVATILSEMSDQLEPARLAAAAKDVPAPWAQRLGFLLNHVGAGDRTGPLHDLVEKNARRGVPLLVGAAHAKSEYDRDWKVFVNADVEAET